MANDIRPHSASNADGEGSGDSWLSNPSGMERGREDYLCSVGRFQRSSSQRKEGAAANAVVGIYRRSDDKDANEVDLSLRL